ncbi:16S rRNA (guanine(527)-N(7))-methyltransferase RsmG [Janibacter sp. G349]|uniref:16S rRNA (guanine(527)-N(7))-methyltransferase RsmG n=1 Tax=Janibacter sp. G349 TaxID=3405424 RepID=UPI003B77B478
MTADCPAAPEGARRFFGGRLPRAETFAAVLADTGVSHGLIGPREVPILWERHILNCAVIEDAFDRDARVIDVGSGAGLPGLAVAIARPDLDVHLVEPMQRRTDWLAEAVRVIDLDNVTVHRGRAEEFHGRLSAPFVTARAVAALDKLARWCCPMVEPGGQLVAMKGRSAEQEVAAATKALRKLRVSETAISEHGHGVLDEPTLTVDCTVGTRST